MIMKPKYVDFHTHLELYPDIESAIAECDNLSIATLTVTNTPKTFLRNFNLAKKSGFVRAGLGMHPQLVAERYCEIELFERLLPNTRYVGEVGLDAGSQHRESIEIQRHIFEKVLKACARERGKILSVHSVRATKTVLDMIEEHLPRETGNIVLHWFSGTKMDLNRAIALGCYFSVNQAMLMSEKGRTAVAEIPMSRMLTETDGPFILQGNTPIRPGDVRHAVDRIAKLHHKTHDEIRKRILSNLNSLITEKM